MIRPSSAVKLAWTKLRSKPGTIFGSVIVSSLLFGVLFAGVIVFTGAQKSVSSYIKKAGNDKYLVQVSPYIPLDAISYSSPLTLEDIQSIKAFEKTYYDELAKKHKALGLEYDKQTEISALTPASWLPETLPEEQRVTVNYLSPVIGLLNQQKQDAYTNAATNKFVDLKKLGDTYGANGYYIVDKPTAFPTIPIGRLIQDDKEDFSITEIQSGDMTPFGYYTHAIQNGSYSFTDQKLLTRYLTNNDSRELNGIPVIVSIQEAATLFGKSADIGPEPESPDEKQLWIKKIQQKLTGHTYSACYRNQGEQALLDKIQQDYVNSKNKSQDYVKPSITYRYPSQGCGEITVETDTRSSTEKQTELKLIDTQKKLGTYTEPGHALATFQIVGFKYAQTYTDYSKGADEYVKSLLSPQSTTSAIDIPIQMYESLSDELKFTNSISSTSPSTSNSSDELASRVLEFTSIEDARSFLDKETCSTSNTECDKQYLAAPYGSNFLILDEIAKLFIKIASIALPIAISLAGIIIWFTISRVMTDSRKETAVFRAMGALRTEIAQIYLTYIFFITLFIISMSAALGLGLAIIVNHIYGSGLAATASTAFGIIDDAPTFSLIDLTSELLIFLILLILLISLLASLQPLIRSVRRSPIEDIRSNN